MQTFSEEDTTLTTQRASSDRSERRGLYRSTHKGGSDTSTPRGMEA
jgi:hypothetical protein